VTTLALNAVYVNVATPPDGNTRTELSSPSQVKSATPADALVTVAVDTVASLAANVTGAKLDVGDTCSLALFVVMLMTATSACALIPTEALFAVNDTTATPACGAMVSCALFAVNVMLATSAWGETFVVASFDVNVTDARPAEALVTVAVLTVALFAVKLSVVATATA
jgi:hypothetical protein